MKNLVLTIFLIGTLPTFLSEGASSPSALESARQLLDAKRPGEAKTVLSGYMPSPSELSSYHYLYAKALEGSQKTYDAIPHYTLAYLYAAESGEREKLLLERAETYRKMKYHQEAALCYRSFVSEFPNSPLRNKVYLRLADTLLTLGLYHDALSFYEKAGDSIEALFGKANTLQEMGRTKEANDLYMSLVTRDKGYLGSSQETEFRIGENLRLMGMYQDAKVYFGLVRDPALKYRTELALGLIAFEESQYDEAIKLLGEALQSPERALRRQALLSLSVVYQRKDRPDESASMLLEIRNRFPYGKEYDTAMVMLSGLWRKKGKYDEAITVLKELVYRRIPVREAFDELERIITDVMGKDSGKFLTLWNSAGHFLMEPSRVSFLLKVAEGLKNTGMPYFELCSWLSKYGSGYAKAYGRAELAVFYAGLGDAERSAALLRELKGFDESDESLRIHAQISLLKGALREAAESLMAIKNKRLEDLVSLAPLLKQTRNPDEAIVLYRKTLGALQNPPGACLRFADALYDLGRKEEALEFYRLFASNDNREGIPADDVTWALYRISIISGSDESTKTVANLGREKTLLGRFGEARLKDGKLADAIKGIL
jgi:tetratricopeptide (TPR) repeat protein